MKFQNKEDCVHAIKIFHLKQSLTFAVQKSDTKRYVLKYLSPKCLVKCRASRCKKSDLWVIGKLNGPHTCKNYTLSLDHHKFDFDMICTSIKKLLEVEHSIKVNVIFA